ncbi:MAG TPA: YceI family protein [Myxococcales bacterium]|nr:YceI family protein [Myxococcales bacterium]
MRQAPLFVLVVLLAPAVRAEVQAYRLAEGKDGPGITLSLPFTFGTHTDRVLRVSGELHLDPDSPERVDGTFRVPIDAIVSDSAERDCHMREALGLDYSRSQYPREHVCKDDRIPAGMVAYPDIALEIRGAQAPPVTTMGVGKDSLISAQALWTIHGVTRPARLRLGASRDAKTPGALRLRGTSEVRLSDFGVVVKSAHVLFVTSSVGEVATVQFDLLLVRKPAGR